MPGRELLIGLLVLGLSGCVERTLTVRSDPPEARLTLNGTEVGRTPFTHDFVWYGTYDVELRKAGYETLKARGPVIAPWWQWVPFDLLAEMIPLPLKDHQFLSYTMRPLKATQVNPRELLERAESMEPNLRSSEYTRPPTTIPLRPTTRASTRPRDTSRPSHQADRD